MEDEEAAPGHRLPDDKTTIVLLAGTGDATDIVANFLRARFAHVEVVVERPPSRVRTATRRAKRVGWSAALGQVLFAAGALPFLRWRGRQRIREIVAGSGLDATTDPHRHRVPTVNVGGTVTLLQAIDPVVVVVQGTRIISKAVLADLRCPVVNLHAGLTPRYRGVHGGYWALRDGRPDLVGTTVHLVDAGIDTGGVLDRATFTPARTDTIATYPYLHLAAGLPRLADQVARVLGGQALVPVEDELAHGESHLYLHPTLWDYLRHRVARGVR